MIQTMDQHSVQHIEDVIFLPTFHTDPKNKFQIQYLSDMYPPKLTNS